MKYKRVQHLLALASEEEAKLANILNGAKQDTFLKVSFTERVLHSSCPEDHYYVLTHHDDKMKIKIIDLLNKIANNEEVPKKIKWENIIYD